MFSFKITNCFGLQWLYLPLFVKFVVALLSDSFVILVSQLPLLLYLLLWFFTFLSFTVSMPCSSWLYPLGCDSLCASLFTVFFFCYINSALPRFVSLTDWCPLPKPFAALKKLDFGLYCSSSILHLVHLLCSCNRVIASRNKNNYVIKKLDHNCQSW